MPLSVWAFCMAKTRKGLKNKIGKCTCGNGFPGERGVFNQLIRELEVGDVVVYKEFFCITKKQFCFLLGKVFQLIQKKEQPTPINAV